jgi:hypothetical protein
MLQLIERFRQQPGEGVPRSIAELTNYVATVANHACDHYLRAKYPLRWQLRNRIRYALENERRFALWRTDEGVWLCGKAGWHTVPRGRLPDPAQLTVGSPRRPRELLVQIFALSGGPLELGAIVDFAATVWGTSLGAREHVAALERLPDPRPSADVVLEQRRNAQLLWHQVKDLPVRQRQALMLNLKDDGIRLFVQTGTASLAAMADALEMSVADFASIWNDLPLADNAIAARLGCTRQQVINLRMAARKRLANRLAGWS